MGNDFQGKVPSTLTYTLSPPHTKSLNLKKHKQPPGWPDSGLASVPGQAQAFLLEWYKDILSIMEIKKEKPCFQKPV